MMLSIELNVTHDGKVEINAVAEVLICKDTNALEPVQVDDVRIALSC